MPGLPGYPIARHLSFDDVRLHDATVVVEATQVAPERPVEGLTLTNITGTAKRGIALQHARAVVVHGYSVTITEGPRLATADVTGTGLEGATPYLPPQPPK